MTATATSSPTVTATSTTTFTPTATAISGSTASSTASPITASIFTDGFETGNYSNWTTTTLGPASGSVNAVVASAAFAGGFGAELSNGVGGMTSKGSSISKTFTAPANQVVSAQTRIRVTALSGAGTLRLFQFRDSVSGQAVVRVRYANGVAQLLLVQRNLTQVTANFATNLTTGTWHRLELTYDWSGAQPVGQAWVDGVLQAQIVDSSSGSAIVPNTLFGMAYEDVATASVDASFDEVHVANGFIGNVP